MRRKQMTTEQRLARLYRLTISVVAFLVLFSPHLGQTADYDTVNVTTSYVRHKFIGMKQIIRTSSGRLYYFNEDGGGTGIGDTWVEVHTSPTGEGWEQIGTTVQLRGSSAIGAAVDSGDVVHMIAFDWNARPYYERFNTLESLKGDHSWEG